MKAIVVRKLGTKELVCFGPDNNTYDPGVPPGAFRAIEPDYTAVVQEWAIARTNDVPASTQIRAEIQAAATIADIKAVLLKVIPS